MNVLQIIDSLDAGGAERMAVNIANELAATDHPSFLVTTRKEGLLRSKINDRVGYFFLQKKRVIDVKAIYRLGRFIKEHHINIIHAHSSSYFIASIMRIMYPKLKLIWHDHYGNSEKLVQRPSGVLKLCSKWFDRVISVNYGLQEWAKQVLGIRDVVYMRNFAVIDHDVPLINELPGKSGKRIVHLANFRPQKDHITLLKAFANLCKEVPDWSLLLVGKSFNDDYYQEVMSCISKEKLENNVHVLGSRSDVHAILSQCDIGVLSSQSEGLPLALIEYGLSGLAVITTDVGACREVIADHGVIIPAGQPVAMQQAMLANINDPNREEKARRLQEYVMQDFGASTYIKELTTVYQQVYRND